MNTKPRATPRHIEPMDLAERLLGGERAALARLLTLVENDSPRAADACRRLYPKVGRSFRIGVTGPPGAGKSTLIDALIREYRKMGRTVGVVAVDPSSPITGGALLGDRIRMDSGSRDAGVFIRSMAGRGHPGGLALRTVEVSDILDAFGFDVLLIETIGTGQDEVAIVKAADVVVLVLNPGAGDGIQALKAGLMEVADLIVIHKADREGAEELRREIESALDFRPMEEVRPPVLLASALRGTGLAELIAAIDAFRAAGEASGLLRRRREERLRERVRRLVEDRLRQELWNGFGSEQTLETWVQRILDRREGDPWTAADEIYGRTAGGRMHA